MPLQKWQPPRTQQTAARKTGGGKGIPKGRSPLGGRGAGEGGAFPGPPEALVNSRRKYRPRRRGPRSARRGRSGLRLPA